MAYTGLGVCLVVPEMGFQLHVPFRNRGDEGKWDEGGQQEVVDVAWLLCHFDGVFEGRGWGRQANIFFWKTLFSKKTSNFVDLAVEKQRKRFMEQNEFDEKHCDMYDHLEIHKVFPEMSANIHLQQKITSSKSFPEVPFLRFLLRGYNNVFCYDCIIYIYMSYICNDIYTCMIVYF